MNFVLQIPLQTTPEQAQRLRQLQSMFAAACNALAPLVQSTGCWNRVALHHLAYRQLRLQFPQLGSQMICNVLYSVSRTARLVYQHPQSPHNAARLAGRPLPLLRFMPRSPVYFDRHTLSLREGRASMYTLDGRMRFNLPLTPESEQRFRTQRLREIVLLSQGEGYCLSFGFGEADAPAEPVMALPTLQQARQGEPPAVQPWPEYLHIAHATQLPGAQPAAAAKPPTP